MNTKKPDLGFVENQRRRERRRTLAIRAGGTALIVGLALAIGFAVIAHRSHPDTAAGAPSAFTTDGGLVFGNPQAPVTVSVTEDFQCPACRQFETVSGATLNELVDSGHVRVEYHPIAILDRMSSTKYSTRAANASACVAETDRARWPAWKSAMFAAQPAEGGTGLPDDQLIAIAAGAGIDTTDLAHCVTDQRYTDWVTTTTETALHNGIHATPTITVNDAPVTNPTPDGLRAAVAAAAP